MGGGLIHIATYASNDLYLTGAPQVTFYKMVYRRYTNFSMESIYLNFDDDINFDHESELTPPRIGDLLHKSYLHISIPNIAVTKADVGIDTSDIRFNYLNKSTVSNYESIKSVYMNVMANIYRISYKAVNAVNVSYTGLVQDVQAYVSSNGVLELLNRYDGLLLETKNKLDEIGDPKAAIMDSTRSNLWYIITHIDINELVTLADNSIDPNIYPPNSDEYVKEIQKVMKQTAFKEIDKGMDFCKEVQQYFFDEYEQFVNETVNDKSKNIRAAWVKNLGHSIIEYIDVYIGGRRIDRHLGIWINIWYQLTYKDPQIDVYNKMIGNVANLTNFDNLEKPAYDIYVPLTFWFNKFNGLSFPLIAMQYNDLSFVVKLRKLEEVFYIEKIYKGYLNGSEVILTADLIDFIQNRSENRTELTLEGIEEVQDIVLTDIWNNKGKMLHGHIVMDYIYIESVERKRFAQSGHEYLIERIQSNIFDNIQRSQLDVNLDFTNPCKELIWVYLKDIYATNTYGWNECRWYDHSVSGGVGNPVLEASLQFNNYTRIQKQVGMYFDVYQPYVYHRVSPSAGINMYSFCLDPLQQQPTGSTNFSRLSDVKLFMLLDEMYFRYTDEQIYPHDLDINFTLTITDPSELIEAIDIEYVNKLIKNFKLITDGTNNGSVLDDRTLSSVQLKRFEDANSTLYIYNQLLSGKTIEIQMEAYRRLLLKTTATFYVFNMSMNILRIIGGYGELAYSGNN